MGSLIPNKFEIDGALVVKFEPESLITLAIVVIIVILVALVARKYLK
jgi:hypothetical protein